MKRIEMIKSKKDFTNIINNKDYKSSTYYIIYKMKSENELPKYGIAVSKKFGKAVDRNRIKRQTRSIIDENKIYFKNYHNYIIMIKKACYQQSYQQLNECFKKMLKETK